MNGGIVAAIWIGSIFAYLAIGALLVGLGERAGHDVGGIMGILMWPLFLFAWPTIKIWERASGKKFDW